MKITTNALQIGDTLQQTGLTYCEADNTYTPYTYTLQAALGLGLCRIRARYYYLPSALPCRPPQHQLQLAALEGLKVRLA